MAQERFPRIQRDRPFVGAGLYLETSVQIKSQKDFWSGVMFILAGVGFAWGATNYNFGSAARPGPGYFPFGLGILLAMTGRTGLAVLGQSAGIAANLAVGLLLIPQQGAAGAATAAVAALVVWNLVLVVVVRRKLGFDPTLLSALR